MITVVLVGFVIGFAKSLVPTGPTGVLVIERALARRYVNSLSIAAGGAAAELVYCLAAVLGLEAAAARHPHVFVAIRELGALVVLAVGAYLLLRPPLARRNEEAVLPGREFLLGLSTTGLNPTLLFTWTVAVGLLVSVGGLRFEGAKALAFPAAVVSGALTWNLVMVLLMRRLGDRLSERTMRLVLRILGGLLIASASWQLLAFRHGVRIP
jgi:threonine/homoserine/homoserine lactone efflux protein